MHYKNCTSSTRKKNNLKLKPSETLDRRNRKCDKRKHKAYVNIVHKNTQAARLNYLEKRNNEKGIVPVPISIHS